MKRETWLGRIVKAIKLDADFYARVASDTTLNREALWLVVSSALVTLLSLYAGLGADDFTSTIVFLLWARLMLASFFARVRLTHFVGRRFFDSTATYARVQRTLDYAFVTRYLRLVTIIPGLCDIVTMEGCFY